MPFGILYLIEFAIYGAINLEISVIFNVKDTYVNKYNRHKAEMSSVKRTIYKQSILTK